MRYDQLRLSHFYEVGPNNVSETEGLSSGCEASGFREEIARDYAALQTRLGREFSDRRGKLYACKYLQKQTLRSQTLLSEW